MQIMHLKVKKKKSKATNQRYHHGISDFVYIAKLHKKMTHTPKNYMKRPCYYYKSKKSGTSHNSKKKKENSR